MIVDETETCSVIAETEACSGTLLNLTLFGTGSPPSNTFLFLDFSLEILEILLGFLLVSFISLALDLEAFLSSI